MQWTGNWHTKTWSRRSVRRCESCNGTATRKEFLDQEINEHEDDEKFNYCQWDTTDWAILTTITATYKEYKETLIVFIDDLTRHSDIAKLQITGSWYRTKSKATAGVKNTGSYSPWLYTTWSQIVASNMIHCVLVLVATTITQTLYQVQTMFVYYPKANHPHIIKN